MVDSMSTLSSLELTRNPFDSSQEERVNCPGFSPSMFYKQETPASQKVRKNMLEFFRVYYIDYNRILFAYNLYCFRSYLIIAEDESL